MYAEKKADPKERKERRKTYPDMEEKPRVRHFARRNSSTRAAAAVRLGVLKREFSLSLRVANAKSNTMWHENVMCGRISRTSKRR